MACVGTYQSGTNQQKRRVTHIRYFNFNFYTSKALYCGNPYFGVSTSTTPTFPFIS